MKKTLSRICALTATFATLSCQSQPATAQPPTDREADGKTLVVYYSYTNNTEEIVTDLCQQIDADIIEVQPAEKGLDYAANNYAIGTEQLTKIRNNPTDGSSYPAIDPIDVDMSEYSTVIIATPLWWSQMASNMQTFLFKFGTQMTGKNIGLIVSSYSSSINGVERDAKRLVPEGKFFDKNLWINNSNHSHRKTLIEQWLKDIGLQGNPITGIHQPKRSSYSNLGRYALNGMSIASRRARGIVLENGKKAIEL